MNFNLESNKNREVNEISDVKVNSEQLSESEKTAENFDDCFRNEVQDNKSKEVNAESLKETEENYDDCEAKMEEMEEKNPELAEEDDDFNDCGKEADGQYVAKVTYITDGEISQEEASAELQEAYNECDESKDMQQLKENANENEHIEVHNAEVIEHPENGVVADEVTEEYEQAQEKLKEAKETLEAQQEAAQEYNENLENEINKYENKVLEKTENINNDASEENQENMSETEEGADGSNDSDVDETIKDDVEHLENTDEDTESSNDNFEDVSDDTSSEVEEYTEKVTENIDYEAEEKSDEIEDAIKASKEEQETVEVIEESAEERENDQIEQNSEVESKSLQERIDAAFEKDDVSYSKINDLREENATELKVKIEEKATTEAELKSKFDEVISKEKDSEEYKQSLKEYNALQDQKANLNEQISAIEKQQEILDKKSVALRNEKIVKGNEAIYAAEATFLNVNTLYDRYENIYYDKKINEDELKSLKNNGYSIIKELSSEQDLIKEAMNAKMEEIHEYVVSKKMNKHEAIQDFYHQQLSAEYTDMKKCYDRINYSIVKLDENNKSISERLGDKYISVVDSKELAFIINDLEEKNVDYHPIELPDKKRTADEIIERLSGGDLTEGSCSSLALAYVGNKAGYDVLDFRDGESRSFFSSRDSIQKITNLPNINSMVIYGKNDIECVNNFFEKMEIGKEYYLATGQHASIVKRNKDNFEYLELQHPSNGNGWHNLDKNILMSRFGCRSLHSSEFSNFLIDVESLSKSRFFLNVLGYINTSGFEQRKGIKGNVR